MLVLLVLSISSFAGFHWLFLPPDVGILMLTHAAISAWLLYILKRSHTAGANSTALDADLVKDHIQLSPFVRRFFVLHLLALVVQLFYQMTRLFDAARIYATAMHRDYAPETPVLHNRFLQEIGLEMLLLLIVALSLVFVLFVWRRHFRSQAKALRLPKKP